jgi:hypothetical protein
MRGSSVHQALNLAEMLTLGPILCQRHGPLAAQGTAAHLAAAGLPLSPFP